MDGIAAALASLASPASCTGCAAICRLDFGAAILWRLHLVFSVCLQRSISSCCCCCCCCWWLPCCGLSIIFDHGGGCAPFLHVSACHHCHSIFPRRLYACTCSAVSFACASQFHASALRGRRPGLSPLCWR